MAYFLFHQTLIKLNFLRGAFLTILSKAALDSTLFSYPTLTVFPSSHHNWTHLLSICFCWSPSLEILTHGANDCLAYYVSQYRHQCLIDRRYSVSIKWIKQRRARKIQAEQEKCTEESYEKWAMAGYSWPIIIVIAIIFIKDSLMDQALFSAIYLYYLI